MATADNPENKQLPHEGNNLGQISKKRAKPKCTGGRMEHTFEPEWKGNSFDKFKCRFCGKREPV